MGLRVEGVGKGGFGILATCCGVGTPRSVAALHPTKQTRRCQLHGLITFADPESAFLEGDLEGHGTIRQGAEGLDLIGGVLPDEEVVHAGELVNPGEHAGGAWFPPRDHRRLDHRPQDFAKGFVSC